MNTPSLDEQRKFLMIYYRLANTKGLSSIENLINMASLSEVKEMVIDTIPEIIELTNTGNARGVSLDEVLSSNGLPPFAAFNMMNRKRVSKILRCDRIDNQDDAIVLRDALDAGLIKGDKRLKASSLLIGWV